MQPKYLFVTGGVASSLGKGLATASIGTLLEGRGLKVAMLKLDPYLNVDPGTMNPFQHGEVYVTDDGAETDLDLGHYFRFTSSPLSKASNATSGQIYHAVIKRERKGDYLGQTVQVIPHITDEIKQRLTACGKQEKGIDLVIVEVGGTVGDIESLPMLEAIRQYRQERPNHCLNIHLTYVPYLAAAGEIKTKPTQHSVQTMRGIGLVPDVLICRCEFSLSQEIKEKLSLFCSVPKEAVIEAIDVKDTIYSLPLLLHNQGIDKLICDRLGFSSKATRLAQWKKIVQTVNEPKGTVKVGIVGKYVQHQDAYKSVYEALHHGALALGYAVEIETFEADKVVRQNGVKQEIGGCDGYLVPGGFGDRGWLGKIKTAAYCREHQIPYFGICLGMQAMVVEFARGAAGLPEANSTEFDPATSDPVISLLSEQEQVSKLGGTMRLGAFPCSIKADTRVAKIYSKRRILERHRHRYEFNRRYEAQLKQAGLTISGEWEEGGLAEIAEIKDHPWMIGVQYHPEFLSKPTDPHPLFKSFVEAMISHQRKG